MVDLGESIVFTKWFGNCVALHPPPPTLILLASERSTSKTNFIVIKNHV